jgi:hypothetical protein
MQHDVRNWDLVLLMIIGIGLILAASALGGCAGDPEMRAYGDPTNPWNWQTKNQDNHQTY